MNNPSTPWSRCPNVLGRPRPRPRRPVETLEARTLLAAVLTPDAQLTMEVGNTGEFQVYFGDDDAGHIFVGEDSYPDSLTPEQPGTAGPLVRLYDRTHDGAPGPGTTYGLPRVFNLADSAEAFAPVDQSGDGTDEVTTTFAAGDLLEITQTVDKPFSAEDNAFARVTNTVRNTGTAPITFDFFAAADVSVFTSADPNEDYATSFGSRDEATGRTVAGGYSNSQAERLFFQSDPAATTPALPAPAFTAGSFDAVWDTIFVDGAERGPADLHLDNLVAGGFNDNAVALEWRAVTIAPGATQSIVYYVAFKPVAPGIADDAEPYFQLKAAPDVRNTTTYRFDVIYLDEEGIDADTIGDGDVEVRAVDPDNDYDSEDVVLGLPAGADPTPQSARLISKAPGTGFDGEPGVVATYEVLGPFARGAAGPSPFPAGQYMISVRDDAVADTSGQFVPGFEYGVFEVGPPQLSVNPTTDAAALQSALFGGTGVTVTDATVSSQSGANGAVSVGTFTTDGDVLGLPAGNGVILGTGDVRSSISGGDLGDPTMSTDTLFETAATPAEQDLLEPLAGGVDFLDVTRVDLAFDAPAGVGELFFNFAFGTEENPPGSFGPQPDVFALYVNGERIAGVNAQTSDLNYIDGTKLDRVLQENGSATVTRAADLNPTGNTLTLIIGDAGDAQDDATAYVQAALRRPGDADLDAFDGGFGDVTLPFNNEGLAYDGDKVVAVGWDSPDGSAFSRSRFVLRRVNPDGTADAAFGGGDGQVETEIAVTDPDSNVLGGKLYDVAVAGDRIYVAGEADTRLAVAAYRRSDGVLDTTFAGDGIADIELFPGTFSYGKGYALALDGDNVVVAGQNERPIGGKYTNDLVLARFNTDGTLDAGFTGGGRDLPGVPDGVVVTQLGASADAGTDVIVSGGRILVAGYADQRVVVTAYQRADGAPDLSFNEHESAAVPDGKVVVTRPGINVFDLEGVVGITAQPDGKIVVVANAGDDVEDLEADFGVARLHPDGRLDEDFGAGDSGFARADFGGFDDPDEVEVLADGRILVTGTSRSGAVVRNAVALFGPGGDPVTDFGDGGRLLFDPVDTANGQPAAPGTLASGLAAGTRRAVMATRGVQAAVATPRDANTATLRALTLDSQPPLATLTAPEAVTGAGAQAASLRVTFTDLTGVDVSDITTDTLSVVRQGTTVALTVTGVTLDATTDGAPRVATYTVLPADNSWGPEDEGVYDIAIKGGLISDAAGDGNVMPGGSLGTLTVNLRAAGELLGTAGARKQTFMTSDGTPFTVTVKGGTGQVFRAGDVIDVDLTGSSGAAAVTIASRRGARLRLGDVTAPAGLRSLSAKAGDLTGDLTAGSVGKVVLAAVTGGRIEGTSIASLAAGGLTDARLTAGGTVGKVTVTGNVTGSTIFAGVRGDLAGLPDGRDDFANGAAVITSVSVRGTFTDSRIAAPTVRRVALGPVQTANSGAAFGLAGGFFSSVSAPAPVGRNRLLDTTGESKQFGDFLIRVLGPGAAAASTIPSLQRGGTVSPVAGGSGAPPARP